MYQNQESDKIIIEKYFDELSNLNEPYDLSINHSDAWLHTFSKMAWQAKLIAEAAWPQASKEKIYNPKSQEEFYWKPMDYEKTVIHALYYYDPKKQSKNNENGKAENVTFWQYFMFLLRNDVFKRYTEIKTEMAINARSIKISKRKQKKINKLIHVHKMARKENPELSPDINSIKVRPILIASNICKDEKELDDLLKLNRNSYSADFAEKDTLLENSDDEKNSLLEQNKFVADKILTTISTFLILMEKAYLEKIHLKEQNDIDQKLKEEFMKEILTCYYMNKFIKKFPNLDTNQIIAIFRKSPITSRRIIREYEKKNEEIREIITSYNRKHIRDLINKDDDRAAPAELIIYKHKLKDIKELSKKAPVTLELISYEHDKQKNYGTRRITDFRKFFRKMLEATDESEGFLALI